MFFEGKRGQSRTGQGDNDFVWGCSWCWTDSKGLLKAFRCSYTVRGSEGEYSRLAFTVSGIASEVYTAYNIRCSRARNHQFHVFNFKYTFD